MLALNNTTICCPNEQVTRGNFMWIRTENAGIKMFFYVLFLFLNHIDVSYCKIKIGNKFEIIDL